MKHAKSFRDLEVAFENEYIDTRIKESIMKKFHSVGRMLNSMIEKASSFCNKK